MNVHSNLQEMIFHLITESGPERTASIGRRVHAQRVVAQRVVAQIAVVLELTSANARGLMVGFRLSPPRALSLRGEERAEHVARFLANLQAGPHDLSTQSSCLFRVQYDHEVSVDVLLHRT